MSLRLRVIPPHIPCLALSDSIFPTLPSKMSKWAHYSEPDPEFEQKREELKGGMPWSLKSLDDIAPARAVVAHMVKLKFAAMEMPSEFSKLRAMRGLNSYLYFQRV